MLPFSQSGPFGIRNGSADCIKVNGQLENPATSVAEQVPACPGSSGDEIWSRNQEKMSERPEAAGRTSRASSITSTGSCTSAGDSLEKGKKGIKGMFTTAFKKMIKTRTPSSKCSPSFPITNHPVKSPFPQDSSEQLLWVFPECASPPGPGSSPAGWLETWEIPAQRNPGLWGAWHFQPHLLAQVMCHITCSLNWASCTLKWVNVLVLPPLLEGLFQSLTVLEQITSFLGKPFPG